MSAVTASPDRERTALFETLEPRLLLTGAPVAVFSATPDTLACGQQTTLDASGSYHEDAARSIILHEWDVNNDGVYDVVGGGPVELTAFSQFGSYDITLRVTDDSAVPQTDTVTHRVHVRLGNNPPVVDLGGPYSVQEGDSIWLNGGATTSGDDACGDYILEHEWDLDHDGSYEYYGFAVNVPWADLAPLGPGPHTIAMRATDSFGISTVGTTTLTILSDEPVASFVINPNPAACGQQITFDASGSYHADAAQSIVLYEWDFDNDGVFDSTSAGAIATHTYSTFGSRIVTLRITDDSLTVRTDRTELIVDVTAGNAAPIADAGGPYDIAEGQDLQLDATASVDPDGACGDFIEIYEWDIDDNGVFDSAGATLLRTWAQLAPLGVGTHTIRLRVTDSLGAATVATTTLDITGQGGDADGNGAVDLDDFVILKRNFGATDNATWGSGDFDNDYDVDLDDFVILKSSFGAAPAPVETVDDLAAADEPIMIRPRARWQRRRALKRVALVNPVDLIGAALPRPLGR